ncbi:MAG TPA: nickel-binding protein [Puia sp.]|nr:nickel-binding protein [Puia sp.]
MPIYMDIHQVPGIEAIHAAEAHSKDLQLQREHQCKCITYWIDEIRGVVFCLIEGPDQQAIEAMHRSSHGLVPNKIIEVSNEVVDSFLGRIQDPENATLSPGGLKVFSDSAFRILVVTTTKDPALLRHQIGERADELLDRQSHLIRKELAAHHGREVEATGSGFIISFTSATEAMACAMHLHQEIPAADRHLSGLRIVVNAGDPVEESNRLFGDTISLARALCTIADADRISITSSVRELLPADFLQKNRSRLHFLSVADELLMESMFSILEKNWQESEFGAAEFCKALSMSKSQLYRKTVALFDSSPNDVLKDFRLDKACGLLKKGRKNISETTFDSGFTSPSYFTKCFKKKFGLLPANYLDFLD